MNNRTKWLAFGVTFFAFYTLYRFGYAVVQPPGFIPNDFSTFHTAALRLAQGVNFYQGDDSSPFKYSPTFLVIFSPVFLSLSKFAAWFIWCAISAIALATSFFIFLRKGLPTIFDSEKKIDRWFFFALTASIIFGWHGYIEHFSYGQVDVLLLSFFALATIAPRAIAIVLMSFVLITKPQAIILLSFWAFTQDWRRIFEILLGTIILLGLPAFWWGVPHHVELFTQWKSCLGKQDYIFMTGNLNQSLAAAIARLSLHKQWVSTLSVFFVALAAIGTLLITIWIKRKKDLHKQLQNPAVRIRLSCIAIGIYLVVTPLSWRWLTFIWMPVATVLFYDVFLSEKKSTQTARIALTVFAIAGLVIQRIIANAIGIAEVDELSWAGLYAIANLSLLVAATSNLFQKTKRSIEF